MCPHLGVVSPPWGCVPPPRGRGCPSTSTPGFNPALKKSQNYCKVQSKALEALTSRPELFCFPCPSAHWEALGRAGADPPRARTFLTKCHCDSWLESTTGTTQPWAGPWAPSSVEKTPTSATDAKSRAAAGSCCPDPSAPQHKCHHTRGTWWSWNVTTASTGVQVWGARGEEDFGAVIPHGPRSSEHFSSIASPEPVTAPHHWGHPECPVAVPVPVPVPTRAASPVPSPAELLLPPDPAQVLETAIPTLLPSCSSTQGWQCPGPPAPCPPLCHPCMGTMGCQQLPALISQPDNHFPYIMPGLTRLPAAAQFPTWHGRRRGVSLPAFIPRGTEPPKNPRGSLCPSPSSPSAPPKPKSCQHLPPWRAGGNPRVTWRGLPGRVPAVSPRQCRLPWQDSRLGTAAAKFWGGAARREKEEKPPADPVRVAPCPRSVPGASPERPRSVPGASPERTDGRRRWLRRDCRLRKCARAVYSSQRAQLAGL